MQRSTGRLQNARSFIAGLALLGLLTSSAFAQTTKSTTATKKKPDFLPSSTVLSGFEKVVSTPNGRSFYTIWTRKKDNQMLAELPAGFASQKHFFAMTVSSGERFAGLQAGDMYVYWRRFDKQLALIAPNTDIRSTGDKESKASVQRLFTDRILLTVPILAIGPSGGPIIDMDYLLVGRASSFFGFQYTNARYKGVQTIKKAKAFPGNVELAFEIPTMSGQLQTLHYSISLIRGSAGFQPRKADERIGYFTTAYSDLGKYTDDEVRTRYINRWHLQKADSKLKLSPPKEPIKFYIEHTTPIRYRRWVKEGILSWNKAFEKVGIAGAIEVEYQDATTGKNMDLDPEDVRYNFVRWLNNDIGTAIGPSRVNPVTGEILDADIILTDGWIRHYKNQFNEMLPKIAMQGYSPETLAWLAQHPNWDPRVRLAPPSQREFLRAKLAREAAMPLGGHAASRVDSKLIGDDEYDGLIGRTSQLNGLCMAADGMAFDVATMRMALVIAAAGDDEDKKEEKKKEVAKKEKDADKDKEKPKEKDKKDDKKDDKKEEKKKEEKPKKSDESMLDGMPESFVGPLIAHLVSHEVGHTLGLRHNFKGSSIYTLEEINSEKLKGKTTLGSSVMDYTPVNISMKGGKVQGDYAMLTIGPYDFWAIEYGYTFDKDLKPILSRVAEPHLQFATDEDTSGPDPLARRYDFSKNPLDYANNQIRLTKHHREQILDKFVKDGQSWSKANRGYGLTLSLQTRAVSMMSNWIGGVHIYRDKKGDKNGRAPFEIVAAKKQRDALKFVIDNTFQDEAFGLTPELLNHMTMDKWLDGDDWFEAFEDATWPVHDRIMGIQASTLTSLLNPTTLRRVYDNEFRVPADKDAFTLPELIDSLHASIWSELGTKPKKKHSTRNPAISSLRRNLQQEYLSRIIDLSMSKSGSTAAYKPVSNLSLMELRKLNDEVELSLKNNGDKLDVYSKAHLIEVQEKIKKALEAPFQNDVNVRLNFGGFFRPEENKSSGSQSETGSLK